MLQKGFFQKQSSLRTIIGIIGVSLILIGVLLYLNQFFRIGWLSLLVALLDSTIILVLGIREKKIQIIIPSAAILMLSLAGLLVFKVLHGIRIEQQIGVAALSIGVIWLAVTVITMLFAEKPAWWALIPGSIFFAGGLCLLFSHNPYFSLVLYLPIGLGLAFLVWGLRDRLFGLTIPGALLIGSGLGIYLAWRQQTDPSEVNSLTQTGIMLVWFALSWGLIILSYRMLKQKFIWWPLIPAGVLFMAGLGLFLGGKPSGTLSFFSNAGSIGLIIIGVYLMLMRREVKK
jgi:hypothetical protein